MTTKNIVASITIAALATVPLFADEPTEFVTLTAGDATGSRSFDRDAAGGGLELSVDLKGMDGASAKGVGKVIR